MKSDYACGTDFDLEGFITGVTSEFSKRFIGTAILYFANRSLTSLASTSYSSNIEAC
jgi:hypothetical protein